MNCDTAFDLMTDANGSRSGALARHFETCTRCRQMQETLAPALEFLAQDESSQNYSIVSGDNSPSDSAGRQPFVTVESVSIAQQAASRLAAQAELPQIRRRRLVGQAVRYAAVFAAGLLLALAFIPERDRETINRGQCTRQEGGSEASGRSAAAIQALAQSCAVCHPSAPAPAKDKTTSLFRSERATSWDWLAQFFHEDQFFDEELRPVDDSRCIAGSQRPSEMNAICQRAAKSSDSNGMPA